MKIIASKQVGQLSYMVSSLEILQRIISQGRILSSRTIEYNPNKHSKSYYVSFSRNLSSAASRNSRKWVYGVILDGDKLSERYRIQPYSYSGVASSRSNFRVQILQSYDDGTYFVTFVNFKPIQISYEIYEKIKQLILDMPQDMKDKKNLMYQGEGVRKYKGRKYLENLRLKTLMVV